MKSMGCNIARALLAIAGVCTGLEARAEPRPETVATIPHPGFLENLTETSDGLIYITAAFDRLLWRVHPDGKVELIASYPDLGDILGIAPLNDGFVIVAFQRSFLTKTGMDLSNVGSELLLVDKDGRILETIPGEKGTMFNGLVADGRGKYIIADSQFPVIWQFDPKTKKITEWLRDDALKPPTPNEIGGDGLKVVGDSVFVSNKAGHSIYRIERGADGKRKGGLILVGKNLPAPDDFAAAPDRTLYVPPVYKDKPDQRTPLVSISPDGKQTDVIADAPYGASAIVSRDGKWLYWPTGVIGGLDGQPKQDLLRIPLR
jgi:hypothetical protein